MRPLPSAVCCFCAVFSFTIFTFILHGSSSSSSTANHNNSSSIAVERVFTSFYHFSSCFCAFRLSVFLFIFFVGWLLRTSIYIHSLFVRCQFRADNQPTTTTTTTKKERKKHHSNEKTDILLLTNVLHRQRWQKRNFNEKKNCLHSTLKTWHYNRYPYTHHTDTCFVYSQRTHLAHC